MSPAWVRLCSNLELRTSYIFLRTGFLIKSVVRYNDEERKPQLDPLSKNFLHM
jgi:hypothetical protein